jgi:hypothetical protein
MARTKLLGYGPDLDRTTPGVLMDCQHAVPSLKGMVGAPAPLSGLLPALAAACRGAAVVRKLDDSTRLIAGSSVRLYEAGSSSWTDVSLGGSGGGGYTALTAGYRWTFAQYGNVTLAVHKAVVLQQSSSGAFAAVTAPKASIVETVGQFAFLFDTTEGTYGDSPDRWWCSAFGDYSDWTPSVATQCATGRLIASSGPIRAAKRFGEQIVVYKGRGMFLGTYQGAPEVWRFDEIPASAGAMSSESVVDISTEAYPRHIFMGMDDFYSFDGSRPTPIGVGWVKNAVFSEVSFANARLACTAHDIANSLVYFYYPTSSTLTKCVVYNYKTKQWGRDDNTIECALSYLAPGLTYDDFGTYYATYGTSVPFTYDAGFLNTSAPVPAIFNASHVIQSLTGACVQSSITTGDAGDEGAYTEVTSVRPIFLTTPTTASLSNYHRESLGDSLELGDTAQLSAGKFDVLQSARWHRFLFEMSGNWEMGNYNIYATKRGDA